IDVWTAQVRTGIRPRFWSMIRMLFGHVGIVIGSGVGERVTVGVPDDPSRIDRRRVMRDGAPLEHGSGISCIFRQRFAAVPCAGLSFVPPSCFALLLFSISSPGRPLPSTSVPPNLRTRLVFLSVPDTQRSAFRIKGLPRRRGTLSCALGGSFTPKPC